MKNISISTRTGLPADNYFLIWKTVYFDGGKKKKKKKKKINNILGQNCKVVIEPIDFFFRKIAIFF